MDRTVLTWITFLAVVAARATDFLTTLHFDPTLAHEANPVVRQLGAGVPGLLLSNILILLLVCIVPLMFFWRGRRPHFEQPPADFLQFLSITFYRSLLPRRKLLCALLLGWPLPKDWFQVWRLWGVVMSWATAFGSVVGATSWRGVESWPWYYKLYTTVSFRGYSLLDVIVGIIGAHFGLALYFFCEYSRRRDEWKTDDGK